MREWIYACMGLRCICVYMRIDEYRDVGECFVIDCVPVCGLKNAYIYVCM